MDQEFLKDLQMLEEDQQENSREQQVKQHSTLLYDSTFITTLKDIKFSLEFHQIDNPQLIDQKHYSLLVQANQYAAKIQKEIVAIHRTLAQIFHPYFSQLDSIVTLPEDYCKLVYRISRSWVQNIQLIFPQSLSNAQKLSIQISLPNQKQIGTDFITIQKINYELQELIGYKQILLLFIQAGMKLIAPNLTMIVGTKIAAKLIASAGGLSNLARMPAGNIQVMGSVKTANLGLGLIGRNHGGFFLTMDIVKQTIQKFKMPLIRMLSTNVAKCAKIDYAKTCPSGYVGQKIKEQMINRFQKIKEVQQLPTEKLEPVPDLKPKKRRGGKRARKLKQRYQQSQIRKHQNRLGFGPDAEDQFENGVGKGMLGKMGRVKLGIQKNTKLKPSKKLMQKIKKQKDNHSGLVSNLYFNSNEGMQILNPVKVQKSKVETYFNKQSGFTTVLQNKNSK